MAAIPMPPFIKSIFDTFPLVQYPALPPPAAAQHHRRSQTIPADAQVSAASPTLFVLPRHAQSLAAQLLLLNSATCLKIPIRVNLTETSSAREMPYVYIHGAGGQVIYGDGLGKWIRDATMAGKKEASSSAGDASMRKRRQGSGLGNRITESTLAFSTLLDQMQETLLVARHRDGTAHNMLGLWRDVVSKPDLQTARLLQTPWPAQLRRTRAAFDALQVFVESAESEPEDNHEITAIKVLLVATVHVMLATQYGQCTRELQDLVNHFPGVLELRDSWIDRYGAYLLY